MLADYFQAVWTTLLELAPWLLLGAAAAGALHVLLPADFVRRHFRGRAGVAKAVALGVPLPLCSCGVIPVGLGMKKDGASDGATVGFLIATPQTGVDSILVTASFLGWPFALFKVVAALVTGLVGGWLTDGTADAREADVRPAQPQPGLLPIVTPPASDPCCDAPAPRATNRGRAFVNHSLMILESIWRWLVFGVLASAAIALLVPADSLAWLAGYGGLPAMLAALAIGLPLYVCATASVPIAAALVAAGLPTGAALVFLMAGPASNVATIGAVGKALGRRPLLIYLATISVGSILGGLLFDRLLSGLADHSGHHHVHETPWWAIASAVVLLGLIAKFAAGDLRRALQGRAPHDHATGAAACDHDFEPGPRAHAAPTIEVELAGMHCQSCVRRVTDALAAEPGVDDVHVTLEPQRATVRGDITRVRVAEVVAAAGYESH